MNAARVTAQPIGPTPGSSNLKDENRSFTHQRVSEKNLAWALDPGRWSESQKRRAKIRSQSDALADLLEKAGIEARIETGMVSLSAITGVVTPITAFRPSRFIPEIAARERRPMLNGLSYYLEEIYDEPAYVRFAVITAGDLIPAGGKGELRKGIQKHSRKISRWASIAFERYGMETLFRGSEFTRQTARERKLLDRYPDNPPLYHVHGNVLYRPHRLLSEEQWAEFLAWTKSFFGTHWKDNGRIQDLREIVKYVVKPGELLDGEKPLDPDEAKWLYEELFKARLTAPMGSFKEWWKELGKQRGKVVRVRAGETSRLAIVTKSVKLDHSEEASSSGEDPIDETSSDPVEPSQEAPGTAENIFVGVTMPQWIHSPWAEPNLLIMNYRRRPASNGGYDRLQEILHERSFWRELWDKKGAPTPETALQIAEAWREAGKDTNVVAFAPAALEGRTEALLEADERRRAEAAERAAYKVHTSRVTVRDHRSSTRGIPPDPPPEKVPLIKLEEGESIATAVETVLGIQKSDANGRGAPVVIDIWA